MVIITSPLYVMIQWKIKKKWKKPKAIKRWLNLNYYKGRFRYTSNNIKKEYKRIIKPQLKGLKFKWIITLSYQLYYPDKRKRDKGNVLSIIQKFFLDALTECWCIIDDNDDYIWIEIQHIPIYDKWNGRCEITITETKKV